MGMSVGGCGWQNNDLKGIRVLLPGICECGGLHSRGDVKAASQLAWRGSDDPSSSRWISVSTGS